MKKLDRNWKSLFVFLSIHVVLTVTLSLDELPLSFNCEENEYECAADSDSPFEMGRQYLYSYNRKSGISTEKVLTRLHDTSEFLSENGTLTISAISSCEFLATLEPTDAFLLQGEEPSALKVTLENGNIRRVCSSQLNPAHEQINALKSMLPMLRIFGKTITPAMEDDITLEDSSKGFCLTKYSPCANNADVVIKYQSSRHCAFTREESELLQSLQVKLRDFQQRITRFSQGSTTEICTTSLASLEFLHVPEGLGVCSIEQTNGVVTSSKCVESLEINKFIPLPLITGKFFSSATLTLKEVKKETPQTSHQVAFVKTSIYQMNTHKHREKPNTFSVNELREAVENYSNSTIFEGLNIFELKTQQQINEIKALLRTASEADENLFQFLNEIITSPTHPSKGQMLLEILASVANNENIMKIIQKALSRDLFLSLSKTETDVIMRKIMDVNLFAESTREYLQFSQFLLSYVYKNNNSQTTFTEETKLEALMLYSIHLNRFCERMEWLTGERYCLKMSLINESPIINMMKHVGTTFEQILFLEALSNFQHHGYNGTTCTSTYVSQRNGSVGLWATLNCFRGKPCSKEAKQFYRELIQNDSSASNIQIAAFVAMTRCFDQEDQKVVTNLFKAAEKHEELLSFIKRFTDNRKLNGIDDPKVRLPQDTGLVKDDENEPIKSATASNSIVVVKLPYGRAQMRLETNMLYFDKSAVFPELITLTLSVNQEETFSTLLEVEVFVDDFRNLQQTGSTLDFMITVVGRMFGKTVYLKSFELNQVALIRLLHTFQRIISSTLVNNDASVIFKEKLRQLVMDAVNVDIFDIHLLSQGNAFLPTVSGTPFELSWNVDGLSRLIIKKNDYTSLFSQDRSDNTSCHFVIRPELILNGQISLGFGSYNTNKDAMLQGTLNAAFPLTLNIFRSKGAVNETVKLAFPSFTSPLIKLNADFKDFNHDVVAKRYNSWKFQAGSKGIIANASEMSWESFRQMEVTVTTDRAKNVLGVNVRTDTCDVNLESSLEESALNITGSYYHESKTMTFQIEFQNDVNSKKCRGKFINGDDEYSLDAYYIRDIKSRDLNSAHGFLSCRGYTGTGILCWWPLCEFCGTEYFIGAVIHTPLFRNIKLFEVSVTQVFPKKKIEFVFKSEGVPIFGRTEINAVLTHGNDTSIISNSKIRDRIDEKVKTMLFSTTHGRGDALPESESTRNSDFTTAYFFDSQVSSELLGQSGASITFLSRLPHLTTYEVILFSSEIFYPAMNKGQHERFSYLFTATPPRKVNRPGGYKRENSIRSSQFPIINIDWNVIRQRLDSGDEKINIIIRPLNLIRGNVKLEIRNHGRNDVYLEEALLILKNNWDNIDFNQTYKIYLPDPSPLKFLKGQVVFKTVNCVLHSAGIKFHAGVDGALELNYNFLPHHEDSDDTIEVLTSVTTTDETYGFYHQVLIVRQPQIHPHEGSNGEENNESPRYLYNGTYVLGEQSLKATGTFQARQGPEIFPFSKFNIRVKSVEGKELGMRIYGGETVNQQKMHIMTINVDGGNSSYLEFVNEMNPFDQNPIKASIFLKDIGEAKISDTSKYESKRNLEVKAKWFQTKQIVQGKVAFPTSLSVSPLYVNFDVLIADESDQANVLFHLTSASALTILSNFSVTSSNKIQIRDSKWNIGLEGIQVKEFESDYDDNYVWTYKNLKHLAFSTHYTLPDLEKYALKILCYSYSNNNADNHKYNLKMYRPKVSPFQLLAEWEVKDVEKAVYETDTDKLETVHSNQIHLIASHKQNFLYIFPSLNLDLNVVGHHENVKEELKYDDGSYLTNLVGKVECRSKGDYSVPLCNLLNISYKADSKYKYDSTEPWIANAEFINDIESFIDELSLKLVATYDVIKSASESTDEDDNIFISYLRTALNNNVLKNSYNVDYKVQRNFKEIADKTNSRPLGVKGTYVFTKMYESWDFFEFMDRHKWSSINCGDFHIWTTLVNHTADLNQPSELFTFSSQYISFNEGNKIGSNEGSAKNVTWMELRSMLNINGFGTLKSFLQQPHLLLHSYEGDMEADFLIRTEFSPVKAFRVTTSHEHSISESEDDESLKFDAFTKLNTILNDVELSGTNSLTVRLGKLVSLGNSFMGRFGSAESENEYITVKVFAVSPSSLESEGDNLIHVDAFSSWTNADDDDTDLRIVNDIIYSLPLSGFPLIRFAFVENSTDIDTERNVSVTIYHSVGKLNTNTRSNAWTSRLPMNVISEHLDELCFTQPSLQSVTQLIADDYFNDTTLGIHSTQYNGENRLWHDYNLDVISRYSLQGNASNVVSNTRWFGFEQKLFHCQSMVEVCADSDMKNVDYRVDTSNYCNLLLFPINLKLNIQ